MKKIIRMLVQSKKRPIAILSFLINTLLGGALFYLITIAILTKLESISARERLDYDNPFLALLGLSFGFFVVAYLFYYIVTILLSKMFAALWPKILLGVVSGLLPVICLHLFTFGITLSNAGILMELIVMAVLGALIPIFNKLLTPKE